MQSEQTRDDAKDRILDTHHADQGVTAKRISRKGFEGRHEYIDIYAERTDKFGSLDGGEPKDVTRSIRIADIPKEVSYEVLLGLAEAHGYKLEEK